MSIYVCLQPPNSRICFITLSSVYHQLLPTCSSHEVCIKDFLMCSSVSLTQVSLIQSMSWISLFCTSTDIVHDEILNLKMCVCNIIWVDAENYQNFDLWIFAKIWFRFTSLFCSVVKSNSGSKKLNSLIFWKQSKEYCSQYSFLFEKLHLTFQQYVSIQHGNLQIVHWLYFLNHHKNQQTSPLNMWSLETFVTKSITDHLDLHLLCMQKWNWSSLKVSYLLKDHTNVLQKCQCQQSLSIFIESIVGIGAWELLRAMVLQVVDTQNQMVRKPVVWY